MNEMRNKAIAMIAEYIPCINAGTKPEHLQFVMGHISMAQLLGCITEEEESAFDQLLLLYHESKKKEV